LYRCLQWNSKDVSLEISLDVAIEIIEDICFYIHADVRVPTRRLANTEHDGKHLEMACDCDIIPVSANLTSIFPSLLHLFSGSLYFHFHFSFIFYSFFMVMQHEIPQEQFNKSNKHKVHSMTKKNRSRMKKKIL